MKIAIPKSAKMKSVALILQKRQIARETRTALLESIALQMISIVTILNSREDHALRIQNVDGSLGVFRIQIALFKHAKIGELLRMGSKSEKQRSKILTISVKVYIQNSMKMIRKLTVCQLQLQIWM